MYADGAALGGTIALEESQVAVVVTPEQAMQVKEAGEPSRYLVGIGLQAWYVKMLPSPGLFALAVTFFDVNDRKADNLVAVPG
jgi:hypothetical protein